MIETVRWLGRFHAATEELLSKGAIPFLKIYDVAYYREWAKRTVNSLPPAPQLSMAGPSLPKWGRTRGGAVAAAHQHHSRRLLLL
jgi:hypothetical protein